jgi:hypothetical protein
MGHACINQKINQKIILCAQKHCLNTGEKKACDVFSLAKRDDITKKNMQEEVKYRFCAIDHAYIDHGKAMHDCMHEVFCSTLVFQNKE